MKSDEEIIEQLVSEKDFKHLTPEQKELVLRVLGSEEEYTAMRMLEKMLIQSNNVQEITPDRSTLISLKHSLRDGRKKRPLWHTIIHWEIPAYMTAILVLASGWIVWFSVSPQPGHIVATVPIVRADTIFVTRVDTVFAEKLIYRQVVKSVAPPKKEILLIKTLPAATGVNMKEKEELNPFLVSGSE